MPSVDKAVSSPWCRSRCATLPLGWATLVAHPAYRPVRRGGRVDLAWGENPADAREAPLPRRARRRIPTTTATIGLAVAALGAGALVVTPASAAPAATGEAPGA